MLGYVTCEKPELKVKDFERYNGYYCGVCKSIGKRYGQIPRMVLSYDAAFLALLLAGLKDEEDHISREHCVIHPIKKKTIVRNREIDYAADVMLSLAWHNLLDDSRDEGKVGAKVGQKVFKSVYKKVEREQPDLCRDIKEHLQELSRLEEEKCDSLDRVSHVFASLMEKIFFTPCENERVNRLLGRIGYHLGKWIYLMDAWEDIEEDLKSGAYNPLFYRFAYPLDKGEKTQINFRKRIYDDVKRNLLIYLSEIGKAVDLLELKKNKDIIENIVYLGLLRRTEQALGKEHEQNEKSL